MGCSSKQTGRFHEIQIVIPEFIENLRAEEKKSSVKKKIAHLKVNAD